MSRRRLTRAVKSSIAFGLRPASFSFATPWAFGVVFGLAMLALAGCQLGPAAPPATAGSAAPPHHTAEGFKNNYVGTVNRPFTDLLRWKWAAWQAGDPQTPQSPVPTQAPDLAFLQRNASTGAGQVPAVTWIGHATTLVQANGLNVLTDPIFSDRAFPVQWAGPKRAQPPGVLLADLPPIDVAVISHNHYDHLDKNSVVALDRRSKAASADGTGQTLFLVPLGLKAWFNAQGIHKVVELDWWQGVRVLRGPDGALQLSALPAPPSASNAMSTEQVGADFFLTPVQHWSARSFNDRSHTLWGGWSVFGPKFNWYFSGDTGYSPDFADTRRRFAALGRSTPGQAQPGQTQPAPLFDLALLAIGAYEPRWFMAQQHINPAEAVQIHQDLGAAQSVGIHWGTFELTDEALDQPPLQLAAARQAAGLPDHAFVVLKIGQTLQPAGLR